MIIEQPACFLRWMYPHAVWRMDSTEKVVYLTFDDGPIPQATPFILDTLDRYGIHATFFMVGENAERYPDLLDEVRRRGHRIGNHTHNHIAGQKYLSVNYLLNTQRANETLHTDLFRPPHGWMKPLQYRVLRRQGYRIIMWDLVTRDYSRCLTAQDVLCNVQRYARPGSIITFHDSLRSIDKLRQVLPACLEWLRDQGYAFGVIP